MVTSKQQEKDAQSKDSQSKATPQDLQASGLKSGDNPDATATKQEETCVSSEDTPANAGAPASAEPPAGEVKDCLPLEETLRQEVEQLKDKLMRAMAETENVRRRAMREKSEAQRYAMDRFSHDMLAVADSLQKAQAILEESAPQEEKTPGANKTPPPAQDSVVQNLIKGIELTEKELLGVFERYGIVPVNPHGEKFDPNTQEAMFEEPSKEVPSGHVVRVIQMGYKIGDRLLRPARVAVAKN